MHEEGRYPEPGLFAQRMSQQDFRGKPCLFLDRDGVLVEETNYLHRAEDVAIIGGVAEAIARANVLGVAVVMVTNQAGIGRGYYNWEQFSVVQDHILSRVKSFGAHCDMVFACAYHAEGVVPYDRGGHHWRKPEPGMLLEASKILEIDLSRSHIVGDTLHDLVAGARAGLPGGTLVRTGHGDREWQNNGAEAFAELERTGSFSPARADNAAQAIDTWLASINAGAGAS